MSVCECVGECVCACGCVCVCMILCVCVCVCVHVNSFIRVAFSLQFWVNHTARVSECVGEYV